MTFCTSGSLSVSPGAPTCVLIAASAARQASVRPLQAGPAGERGETFPLRLEDEGGDARQRQARQFRQSPRKQNIRSPPSSERSSKAGVSEPAARKARVRSARSSGGHDEAIVQIA